MFALQDTVRPDAADALKQLHALGLHTVLLTGDTQVTADAVAQRVGVREWYAELLPHEKVQVIERLRQRFGAVGMAGDGINDAPALARADVGVSFAERSADLAIETADVALVGNDLLNLPYAFGLSRYAMRVLVQNIVFATGVIVALVIATFTAGLRLPFGVVGHEGSTLLVVLNGLRLLAGPRHPAHTHSG